MNADAHGPKFPLKNKPDKTNPSVVQGARPWPEADDLVALMQEHGSIAAVAKACGKSRGSLRDYLKIRPELKARMEEVRPEPIGMKESRRRWHAKNPEYRRAVRRRWMRGKRLRGAGLHLLYDQVIRRDPCSYCDGRSDTADHIVAQSRDGEDTWENYTGACRRCNDQKGNTPLLVFLATRKEVMP